MFFTRLFAIYRAAQIITAVQWRRQLWGAGARAPSPRLSIISFLVHFEVNLTATIQILCSLRDQLVQMSTTHSSFDQHYISHKTISHRAAAAPGPEVHRECPKTYFSALPLLATNPGDATVAVLYFDAVDVTKMTNM